MSGVLLTNGFLRKTLAAARDLGQHGVSVTIADAHRPNPSAWSKYCGRSRTYPNPVTEREAFTAWLMRELETASYDMFLPMDDDTMDVAVEVQAKLLRHTRVLLPDPSVYRTLRDKYTATVAAKAFGFPVPATFLLDDDKKVQDRIKHWSGPIVLKPRQASGSRGLRVLELPADLKAAFLEHADTVHVDTVHIDTVHSDSAHAGTEHINAGSTGTGYSAGYTVPMVQAYVPPGPRTDICLLLDMRQNLLASFAQREIRHFPMPYGPSTLQESVEEEHLIHECYRFAKQLGWTGLIEFEFMQDPDTGISYFLEANTRPWNSLHLAVSAGVRFPVILYDYLVRDAKPTPQPYRLGVRCRNLLPTDTLHFLTNRNRWQLNPSFFAGSRKGGVDDIVSLSDPLPTLGFFFALAVFATRKGAIRAALHR